MRICVHLIPESGGLPPELQAIKAAGYVGIKQALYWNLTNPKIGRYEFAPYDRLVEGCQQIGLDLTLVIGYGNNYLYGQPGYPNPDGITDDKLPPPVGYKPYEQWLRLVAARYGSFVKRWQFWGEPNTAQFWKPAPNLAHYVALLKLADKILPGKVYAGNLANAKGTDMPDFEAIKELAKLGAFKGRILGINPYTQGSVDARRKLTLQALELAGSVAWTEFGQSVGWGFTESEVLARNAEGLKIAQQLGIDAWLYEWHNPYAIGTVEKGFGLRPANDNRT